jgi:hypothetical protein
LVYFYCVDSRVPPIVYVALLSYKYETVHCSIFISLIQCIKYNPLVLHQYSNTLISLAWGTCTCSVRWGSSLQTQVLYWPLHTWQNRCRILCVTYSTWYVTALIKDLYQMYDTVSHPCFQDISTAAFSTSSKHTDMKHSHPFKPLECFIQHTVLETICYTATFLAHTSVKCQYNALDQIMLEGIWMSISRNIPWPCTNYIHIN